MFNKVKSIKCLENYKLLVIFEKGENKIYDVSLLFSKNEMFCDLKTDDFYNVTVEQGGYGISWNDEIDISCDELFINGVLVN